MLAKVLGFKMKVGKTTDFERNLDLLYETFRKNSPDGWDWLKSQLANISNLACNIQANAKERIREAFHTLWTEAAKTSEYKGNLEIKSAWYAVQLHLQDLRVIY